jgi:hypothetical protein
LLFVEKPRKVKVGKGLSQTNSLASVPKNYFAVYNNSNTSFISDAAIASEVIVNA